MIRAPSELGPGKFGGLQGSILELLLFLSYLKNIYKSLSYNRTFKLCLYVDMIQLEDNIWYIGEF